MTRSMTAYARRETKQAWGSLVWELRSVNHRYLEPQLRLPEAFREIEPALREIIRKHLSRGKVECFLRYDLVVNQEGELSINEPLAKNIAKACRQIERLFPNVTPVAPLSVLEWPGVMQQQEVDLTSIHQTALAEFEQTVVSLNETRSREGLELKQFILKRLTQIEQEVSSVRAMMPALIKIQREKIVQRLEEAKVEIDSNRLEQELVLMAQKADVDEEMDRLATHITEVRRVLDVKEAVGRRLDFLMQELNREANTLASKSINADTTQCAVNLKVFIEQMREQVQNIE
ncbi:YicC/YloC family endoribonuclease [Spartinivicinus poritis]|uniref:YicC family protein n=1 Tax=Spartinivicinus poritis TaxID=2994640 RepID=A0ABT5UB40_9GAMM|nr:YicC/YloC family endoribonuclease [Spartinivicinus sp. A2-2]MDE1463578.1 YicC family protein [Spartinivicinus sp. A2-2]